MSRRRGRHHLRQQSRRFDWLTDELRQRFEGAADVAFAICAVIVVDDKYAVVPDLVVEAFDEFPKRRTFRIVRDDGRWADLYRMPQGEAA